MRATAIPKKIITINYLSVITIRQILHLLSEP
jgi:hypothetical protein